MVRTITTSLAIAVLFSAGCAGQSDRRFANGITNKPAREFELKDLSGKLVKSSEFLGKPVLLAFWAYG